MINDGARGLPELTKRIEEMERAIRGLSDKAENGGMFEERYSATQHAARLTKELAIPKAAYFEDRIRS